MSDSIYVTVGGAFTTSALAASLKQSQKDGFKQGLEHICAAIDYVNNLPARSSFYAAKGLGIPQEIAKVRIPKAMKGLVFPDFVTVTGELYDSVDVKVRDEDKVKYDPDDESNLPESAEEITAWAYTMIKSLGKRVPTEDDFISLDEARKPMALDVAYKYLGTYTADREHAPIPSTVTLLRKEDQTYSAEDYAKYMFETWAKQMTS